MNIEVLECIYNFLLLFKTVRIHENEKTYMKNPKQYL